MITNDLVSLFGDMTDPRLDRKKLHSLSDILSIAILAVICGADSWVDIQNFGVARCEWLSQFLELEGGVPSHDTFRRVFSLIDPKEFEKLFVQWVQSISGKLSGQIAIDGKIVKGSGNRCKKIDPLCVVSAWSSELDLVLAHTAVKSFVAYFLEQLFLPAISQFSWFSYRCFLCVRIQSRKDTPKMFVFFWCGASVLGRWTPRAQKNQHFALRRRLLQVELFVVRFLSGLVCRCH